MKWSDVTLNLEGRRLTGGAARGRVLRDHAANVSDKVKMVVVIKKSSGGNITADSEVRGVLRHWYGEAVSFAGDPPPVPRVVPVQRAAPNVVRRDPPLLQLFLDVDRDGTIDRDPAANPDWTWGPDGAGAILTVASRVYANDGDNVLERAPLELAWRQDVGVGWTATLAVDHPDRIRIFRTQRKDAERLLGGDIAGPLALNADPAISAALGRGERVRLWMDAIDYPETAPEADWKVRLTLSFQLAGPATSQIAMLRIAPWIMGSDLDPSDHVYVRFTQGQLDTQEYALATAVTTFSGALGTLVPIGANQVSKGFARDVMKSGYTAAPHYSGVVIQKQLDRSPIAGLPDQAATDTSGATIIKPAGTLETQIGGLNNGGNLLVSPPSAAYPWGRILFGGNDVVPAEAGSAEDKRCLSQAFYRAQAVQRPIRLDSMWLRVGHVDEMLSFVRGGDGQYRALLMSPRLGYIMLRGVASQGVAGQAAFADAAALAAWADGVNDNCIADGVYTELRLDHHLAGLQANLPEPVPNIVMAGVTAFVAAPPVPAASDRFVVARVDGPDFTQFMFNAPLVGRDRGAPYQAAFPPRSGRLCYEVRVHASRFLARADATQRIILAGAQPSLDATRAILRGDLGFTDDRILEVPVILNREGADCVALTGDSVNLLQLAAPASRCLVPKPFGPVYAGEYVYERYLADKLLAMGVAATIEADDKFHVMEGEFHCGTNQTHPPLAGARRQWWRWVAP